MAPCGNGKEKGRHKPMEKASDEFSMVLFTFHPVLYQSLVQRKVWILVKIGDDVTEKLCVYDRLM